MSGIVGMADGLGIPDYFKGGHPQFETIAQGRIDAHMKVPA
jgi:hypothetical protein